MIRKYTITDVAKDLGVSCSTVSRALSASPGVSEKVRKRIIEYANEIGYAPNRKTRSGENYRQIIALVIGDIRNPFYADLSYYIQSALCEEGYFVVVFHSEYNVEQEINFLNTLNKDNFSGVIMMTSQVEKIGEELTNIDLPVVLINRNLNSFKGNQVLLDNFKAGYIATMHLIELGHEHIGFVRGHASSSASRERFDGYCQAMKNYGMQIREENIYYSEMRLDSGEKLANEFLVRDNRPSGLIVINDVTALGFVSECMQRGVNIPEDLSVVSFDNTKFAKWGRVPLTTVDQKASEIGTKAVEVLLDNIQGRKPEPVRIIMDPVLIVRKSTKCYRE